ncbi:MAG: TIGR02453 family protein [Bacteroidetes bacterium HGW-Bacteroidetes-1]|jgi:uncharacterized protein (TIGR02453 family)|nr:MAG: TIGR02453 family protein [Bacteroidetes bacterium HGW-Bacteroidetes-1]
MSNQILHFLSELSERNEKTWFEGHRSEYEHARNELISIVEAVVAGISTFDSSIGNPSPKKCIFRQYRDVRFSKNKLPYKTNMAAYIAPGGKSSPQAGYYLHLEPEKSFAGGGIYSPTPDILKAIRSEIYYNGEEFNTLINKKDFKNIFGEMMQEKLKRPPKGFPASFPFIELIKYKHFVVSRPFLTDAISLPEIQQFAIETFKEMYDFNQFLNRAILNAEK